MKEKELTGRHVLFGLLGFFGIIFAVNGFFLFSAIQTYSGVVANEPYRKGIEYNRRIDAERAQQALGWTHAVALDPSGTIVVDLKDKAAAAVRGVQVTALIGRPSTRSHDIEVTLQPDAEGRYAAPAKAFEAGNWLVMLSVRQQTGVAPADEDAGIVYRAKERVWLKR